MKELFQLSFRCTKLKCGVIWAFVVMPTSVPPLAAPRVKSLRAGCGGRQGRCAAAAFSRVGGTVAKSAYYTRLWASFFCKVAGKNPWSRVAVFWAYFTKYGCLIGKSDKQLCFFIYVRRILQCIDWHSVCSQLIANQCNNISAVE